MGGGAAARALLRHVACPSPAPSTRAPVLSRAPCLAGASRACALCAQTPAPGRPRRRAREDPAHFLPRPSRLPQVSG